MKTVKKYFILEEGAESSIEVCNKPLACYLLEHGEHYATKGKARKALELFFQESQAHHYQMARIYGQALKKLWRNK